MTWFEQQLGLVMSKAISNQIIRAHKQVKTQPIKAASSPKLGSLLRDGAKYLATDRTIVTIPNVGGTTEYSSAIPPFSIRNQGSSMVEHVCAKDKVLGSSPSLFPLC